MVQVNQELQQKYLSNESMIEDLKQMLTDEKQRTKEKALELRENNKHLRGELESEMLTLKTQLRNKEEQWEELESIMLKEREINEKRFKDIAEGKELSNTTIFKMKSHFDTTLKDIRAKEIENLKLQLQLEAEKQTAEVENSFRKKLQANKNEMK